MSVLRQGDSALKNVDAVTVVTTAPTNMRWRKGGNKLWQKREAVRLDAPDAAARRVNAKKSTVSVSMQELSVGSIVSVRDVLTENAKVIIKIYLRHLWSHKSNWWNTIKKKG